MVACGGDDDAEPAASATPAAEQADLQPVKDFLLEHTASLNEDATELREGAEEYYAMAEAADFDYAALLEDKRAEVQAFVKQAQEQFAAANPAYEEMEGVVAGVPSLADYDVIIDAGADKSDPENAAPIKLETPARQDLRPPGQLQLPDRDLRLRHRAEVRRQGRRARPRRRRQGQLRRVGAGRRLLRHGRARVREDDARSSTPPRRSGRRPRRTRSPRSS